MRKFNKLFFCVLIAISFIAISFAFSSQISYAASSTSNLTIWHQNSKTDGYGNNQKYFASCVGGSGKDNRVGFWKCSDAPLSKYPVISPSDDEVIDRYKWKIKPSEVAGWYYIVNAQNGKCLSRKSSSNKIRYYSFSEDPCKQSDFRLWRFLDKQGNKVNPFTENLNRGTYKLQLKKSKAGCLSTRLNDFYDSTTRNSSLLTTQNCYADQSWDYPLSERYFNFLIN